MIDRNEFNSEWWGADVGIVREAAFFELPSEERTEALTPYAWAEYRGPLCDGASRTAARAGFFHVDTQLSFRLGLRRLSSSPSLERLEVRFADERPFEVSAAELADFDHERFARLPGATTERINARYALWSRRLLDADPGACMEVLEGGAVQGWFLGRREETGLHLTLAMLHRGARLSGHSLYHRALLAYAARGASLGRAAFSATNTAVHNIYAALGARFLAPTGCWLWVPATS